MALLTSCHNTEVSWPVYQERRIYSFQGAIALQFDFLILLCQRKNQLLHSNLPAMKQSLHSLAFYGWKHHQVVKRLPSQPLLGPAAGKSDPQVLVSQTLTCRFSWIAQLMDRWKTVRLWVPRDCNCLSILIYWWSVVIIQQWVVNET